MSQPTLDQIAPGGVVDLSNSPAPLDEATFDSLFPSDSPPLVSQPAASAQPTAPASGTPQTPAQTPATPQTPSAQPNAPFLKAATSVYNTPEAAIDGINQKDALIEQLRQRYALTTGIDPITGQPIVAQPQAQPANYQQDRSKYLDDLYEAAKKGGPDAYVDVQTKFMMDTFAPVLPLLQRAAKEQAIEEVAKEIKEVGAFIGTPVYQKTLEANPELKNAITAAESDLRWHSRLPGLYKIAYLSGQGLQLPEILKAQAASQPQPQNPPPQPRPTLQPSTPSLPHTTARPSLGTAEGRRAIIQDAEARGLTLEF